MEELAKAVQDSHRVVVPIIMTMVIISSVRLIFLLISREHRSGLRSLLGDADFCFCGTLVYPNQIKIFLRKIKFYKQGKPSVHPGKFYEMLNPKGV